MAESLTTLLVEVRACTRCAAALPLGPRPVLQADARARILVAGQAPGRRVHASGVPFDDASGERLREWMGVDRAVFHDPAIVAILPMGLCYPGSGGSGDLPPRPECAPLWRDRLLARLPDIALTLVIGRHAMAWHLPALRGRPLAEAVRDAGRPDVVVLPHPSPRNRPWLARHPWFAREVLPALRERVHALVAP